MFYLFWGAAAFFSRGAFDVPLNNVLYPFDKGIEGTCTRPSSLYRYELKSVLSGELYTSFETSSVDICISYHFLRECSQHAYTSWLYVWFEMSKGDTRIMKLRHCFCALIRVFSNNVLFWSRRGIVSIHVWLAHRSFYALKYVLSCSLCISFETSRTDIWNFYCYFFVYVNEMFIDVVFVFRSEIAKATFI